MGPARLVTAVIVVFLLPMHLWCAELRAALDAEIGDSPVTRMSVLLGSARFSARVEGLEDCSFGFSLPWLVVGPLEPFGLLREVANPLGFSPGSDVFVEETGCGLDLSLGSTRMGILYAALPGNLSFFTLARADSVRESGAFACIRPSPVAAVEALVVASEPEAGSATDAWYRTESPFPGGSLLDTAARITIRDDWLSLVMSAGVSAGERVVPGCFTHVLLTMEGDGITFAALGGTASASYRSPGGGTADDAMLVAGTVTVFHKSTRAELRLSHAQEFVGLVPVGAIPSRDCIALSLRREIATGGKSRLRLTASAEKIIQWDEEALRSESASFAVAARARAGGFTLEGGLAYSDDEGVGVSLVGSVKPLKGLQLTTEIAAGSCESDNRNLSLRCALRKALLDGSFGIEAGVEEWPVCGVPADPGDCLRFALSWSTRSRIEGD